MREDKQEKDFQEKVVQIRRVTKVVKGGKKMGFRAVVAAGDLISSVGLGVGKASEVSAAIRKGVEDAKKRMVKINRHENTIPHEVNGNYGASKVLVRPAPRGTGVIAGGVMRTILELCGIKDIVAKSHGSSAAINVGRATIIALRSLREISEEEKIRNKKLNVVLIGGEDRV